MKQLFKDIEIIDNITNIIQDKKFSVKKYWFKKVYLQNLLSKDSKIQYKTAKKILQMYNDYLNLNQDLENIFNTDFLINYNPNVIEFVFKETDNENHHFKFIEKILSINLEKI